MATTKIALADQDRASACGAEQLDDAGQPVEAVVAVATGAGAVSQAGRRPRLS